MFTNFFKKSCRLRNNVEKFGGIKRATDDMHAPNELRIMVTLVITEGNRYCKCIQRTFAVHVVGSDFKACNYSTFSEI